jgi:hypothetical protein
VQRRSILGFCEAWAKATATPGAWASIRSYQIWCLRDQKGNLRVALRHELFEQVGKGGLLKDLGPSRFARLCIKYKIARRIHVHNKRALELSVKFISRNLTRSVTPEEAETLATRGDAWEGQEADTPSTVAPVATVGDAPVNMVPAPLLTDAEKSEMIRKAREGWDAHMARLRAENAAEERCKEKY